MKVLRTVKNIIVTLIVIFAVAMMIFTVVSVSTFGRNDRTIFGYRAYIVKSDSMSATDFSAGDLVLIKPCDPSTLQVGDIIAYTSQSGTNFGEVVTHKIRTLTTDANGEPGFVTYGTTTDVDDETVVTYPYVLGKYTRSIPKVGTFFSYLKTTPGYITCILLPFLIIILSEVVNCVQLFRQYRAEQEAEITAEREKLAAERAETQKMLEELRAMRSEMSPPDETAGTAPSNETAEAAATPETTEAAPSEPSEH